MAYSAGTAYLEVHPSFRNIESMIAEGARNIAQGLDKALGDQMGKATEKATQRSERQVQRSGTALGKTFTDAAVRRIQAALGAIPEADRILKPLRQELEALAGIDLGRGFDEKDFIARVEKAYAALRRAQQDAQGKNAVSRYTNAGNAAQELGAVQDIVEQARKRGFAAGDAFSDAYASRLKAMDRILPDNKITAKSSQEERAVAALKGRIAEAMKLQVGDVATRDNNPLHLRIGAKISGDDLRREMEGIEALLDQFTERFTQLELVLSLDKARQQVVGFFGDIQTQQEKASERAAKEYLQDWDAAVAEQARRERAVRENLAKAYDQAVAEDYKRRKAAQDAFLRDWNAAEAEDWKRRQRARAQFQKDWEAAIAESYRRQKAAQDAFQKTWDDAIAEDYRRQKRQQDVFLRDWEAALQEARRRQQQAADQLQREAERQRSRSVAGETQSMLGRARDRIVDLPVQLQANDIDREMAAIRRRIESLGNLRIGVDIDVESFADQVQAEFTRLRRIADDTDVDIDVRVDAARAATELGGILVLLNRIDKDKATVKVDADGAMASLRGLASMLTLNLGRLGALIALGSSLGTALVPAAAAAASAIGAIGTNALAAGAGLGVLFLGFSGIGEAVKAMGQLEENQQKSINGTNRAASQVESALAQIEGAERSLAETRRNNAQQAVAAQRAIVDALRDQKETVEDVARANEDAADRTARAQRALKDTIDAAREANQRAAERVLATQRNLTRATEDEQTARQRLNEAYIQAQRILEDLASSMRGNALDQRQVILDIAEAKEKLDNLLANPRATQAELEQATINYERRLLQMDDLKRAAAEMEDEQTKRLQQGIENTDEVVSARRALEDAERRLGDLQKELAEAEKDQVQARLDGIESIKDAQKDLDRAERDQQRTREDGIRKIGAAQRAVDDARLAAAEQQRDAAYAEFQAQQSLAAARRQLATATDRSLTAGGAQLDNLNTAMGKLSPTAQTFARYIYGLRDAFYALRDAAAPMLAGLQIAMEDLIGKTSAEAQVKLQPLFDFVGRVATALGGIFQRLADMLQGPAFSRFFGYISDTAVPTLELMYDAFENITVGLVNLFLGFTPLTDDVNQGFLELTESFRKWSETLETNQGFQELIRYMRDAGPLVWDLLGEMIKALTHLAIAAAPVGVVVIKMLTGIFEAINKIPQDVLTALVAGIAAAATAITLFAAGTAVAMLKIPGLIAAGIAIAVVAFSALIGSSSWLREQLSKLWEAIKVAAPIALNFLKGAVTALVPVLRNMGEAAMLFYTDFLKPAFDAGKALVVAFVRTLSPAFDEVAGVFTKLGMAAFWLYDQVIMPAWRGIMAVSRELFAVLKPIFEVIGVVLGAVGQIVFWLLNKVFFPVIGGIVNLLVRVLSPVIQWLWTYIVRPIFRSIGLAVEIAAALIKVAVGVIMLVIKGLGALFEWLYKNAIKPAWDAIVKYVFNPMRDWIAKNIAPHWDAALKTIGKHWENFKKLVGTPIKFIVETLLNDGLLKGYNWLADKFDVEPKNVQIPAPKGGWTGFSRGGAVYGPGTETSDSIRARLSKGEHVLTAAEVRAAGGHQAIYAWRRDLTRRGWDGHAHAKGGRVGGTGDGFGDWLKKTAKSIGKKATDAFDSAADFLKDPLKSMKDLAKGLFDKIPGKDTWFIQRLAQIPKNILTALEKKVTGLFDFSGAGQDGQTNGAVGGNSNTLGGSLGMIGILRQVFPGLSLNSGFRPGSITVTGNLSYHARNRAIDVPPRGDVFEWIRANYPNSRELIFSPKGSRQIHNGRPHVYSGAVRATHYDHVHWAYDGGGLLPDTRKMPGGVMQVFHGRRTPDKVLTDTQWQNMAVLAGKARESMAGGNTYNFPYRDTTLDYDELQRWSARQDALTRVNRLNF